MLEDTDLHVVKRVIRCLSQLYKIAIKACVSLLASPVSVVVVICLFVCLFSMSIV